MNILVTVVAWFLFGAALLSVPLGIWAIGRERSPRGRDDAFLDIVTAALITVLVGRVLHWW